jgi:DNA-binding transcriptional ArsR family regulator
MLFAALHQGPAVAFADSGRGLGCRLQSAWQRHSIAPAACFDQSRRVTDLAASVGMKPQAVSNQLQRLSDLGILTSRREGTSIHYRLVDLCVRSLLDQGICLMEEVNDRHQSQ